MTARCLSTLEALPAEGYTARAARRLAGGRRKFPHRLDLGREDLLTYRTTVIDRMSISGVQDKVSLRLARGTLVPTDTNGGYLLKPVPGMRLPRFQADVPANEHLTMLIAERVYGIDTAVNACIRLQDGELAYITRRFDRTESGEKIPQEDFCQLTERSSETHGAHYKYDASHEELGATLKRCCPAYPVEVEKLFRRLLFVYAFSNGDAHLKNVSLYRSEFGDYVLTPAYDLLCTSLHIPSESRLALDMFADDFETESHSNHGFHTGECFLALAQRFEIAPTRAETILAPFRASQDEVKELIERSFLTQPAKQDYRDRYEDRLKALNIGL